VPKVIRHRRAQGNRLDRQCIDPPFQFVYLPVIGDNRLGQFKIIFFQRLNRPGERAVALLPHLQHHRPKIVDFRIKGFHGVLGGQEIHRGSLLCCAFL